MGDFYLYIFLPVHNTEGYGEMEVELCSGITPEIVTGDRSASRPRCFDPSPLSRHDLIEDWVGPRGGPDFVEMRKIAQSHLGNGPRFLCY